MILSNGDVVSGCENGSVNRWRPTTGDFETLSASNESQMLPSWPVNSEVTALTEVPGGNDNDAPAVVASFANGEIWFRHSTGWRLIGQSFSRVTALAVRLGPRAGSDGSGIEIFSGNRYGIVESWNTTPQKRVTLGDPVQELATQRDGAFDEVRGEWMDEWSRLYPSGYYHRCRPCVGTPGLRFLVLDIDFGDTYLFCPWHKDHGRMEVYSRFDRVWVTSGASVGESLLVGDSIGRVFLFQTPSDARSDSVPEAVAARWDRLPTAHPFWECRQLGQHEVGAKVTVIGALCDNIGIASASLDGTVRIWPAEDHDSTKRSGQIYPAGDPVFALACHPSKPVIALGSANGVVYLAAEGESAANVTEENPWPIVRRSWLARVRMAVSDRLRRTLNFLACEFQEPLKRGVPSRDFPLFVFLRFVCLPLFVVGFLLLLFASGIRLCFIALPIPLTVPPMKDGIPIGEWATIGVRLVGLVLGLGATAFSLSWSALLVLPNRVICWLDPAGWRFVRPSRFFWWAIIVAVVASLVSLLF